MAGVGGLVLLLSLAASMAVTGATQFRVGGSMDWAVPADPNAMSYNQWAEKNRFRIGDSLLFVYPPDQDSVLQVDKNAYTNCNTSSYIAKFAGGNTVFVFNTSGPFYFISGVEPNCIRNESLVVLVMAERSKPPSSAPPSPLSPVSSSAPSTPPASSVEVPPSPAPPASSDEVPPSPAPPTSSVEVPPSSAPGGEASPPPPPPNGASLKVVSFMGSVGAAVGMLLFVL